MGYHLDGVIINRAFPLWLPEAAQISVEKGPDYTKVQETFAQFRDYYAQRYGMYDQFAARLPSGVHLLRVPEYTQDIYGISDLQRLANELP